MNSVRCPEATKGVQKRKLTIYSYKSVLLSKKVCCEVSLCDNFQRQSCRALSRLSDRAQTVGGGRPLKRKFCAAPKLTHLAARLLCASGASCLLRRQGAGQQVESDQSEVSLPNSRLTKIVIGRSVPFSNSH